MDPMNNGGQPMMQNPQMGQPMMQQPQMGQPMMQQPQMGQPMMQQPQMGQPMMQQPQMGQPMMQQPQMGQPMMQQPMGQPMMQQPNNYGKPNANAIMDSFKKDPITLCPIIGGLLLFFSVFMHWRVVTVKIMGYKESEGGNLFQCAGINRLMAVLILVVALGVLATYVGDYVPSLNQMKSITNKIPNLELIVAIAPIAIVILATILCGCTGDVKEIKDMAKDWDINCKITFGIGNILAIISSLAIAAPFAMKKIKK